MQMQGEVLTPQLLNIVQQTSTQMGGSHTDRERSLVQANQFVAPITRKPQVFMFDGVRKRKVILRDAKHLSQRLEHF
jgi:hypothetical protein